ncbi:MAG TPA: DUF370 domain-containing protein [Bacillota bacterium]|nr:DUF370 domain-containing protein [Bacillota bacterium]HPE38676.1 DUF370 domain-containing protein [Bacillota bacterium]
MAFIKVGFGNIVSKERLICVVGAESAPVRRLVQDARDRGTLIDASSGKKCKAVLVMDSEHVVLSSMTVEEVTQELEKE